MRAEILATLEQVLLTEARKLAGDPGVVPPRRLSNAEYDYTIQRSHRRGHSAGEVVPGRSRLRRGLQQHRRGPDDVAQPVQEVLRRRGVRRRPRPAHVRRACGSRRTRWSPSPTGRSIYEQAIIRFYEQHAVDYEKYLTALWLYRHRPPAQKTATVEEWATETTISARSTRGSLWEALQGENSTDKFFLHWLQSTLERAASRRETRWSRPRGEIQAAVRALAADIQRLSRQLCPPETPAIVANAGNGPIEHLARRRRTAESRDTFDRDALDNQRASRSTFPNVTAEIQHQARHSDCGCGRREGRWVCRSQWRLHHERARRPTARRNGRCARSWPSMRPNSWRS